MNSEQLLEIWEKEKPLYEAWGNLVVEKISDRLRLKNINCNAFFKIPPLPRLKDNHSLIEKAFYREDKSYSDPYKEIEDKVGVRFVVLLIKDIDVISEEINSLTDFWSADVSRDYEAERNVRPLEFSYQSLHFVLRPVKTMSLGGLSVTPDTPCEVQIRTLLQHAHAELTHDLLYKSKKKQKPEVKRVSARSMALIETTDDFFVTVNDKVNVSEADELGFTAELDNFYRRQIGFEPEAFSSSVAVWDYLDSHLKAEQLDLTIENAVKNDFLIPLVKKKRDLEPFYRQSVIFYVYWMLQFKKSTITQEWPLSREFLATLAADIGVSIGID